MHVYNNYYKKFLVFLVTNFNDKRMQICTRKDIKFENYIDEQLDGDCDNDE